MSKVDSSDDFFNSFGADSPPVPSKKITPKAPTAAAAAATTTRKTAPAAAAAARKPAPPPPPPQQQATKATTSATGESTASSTPKPRTTASTAAAARKARTTAASSSAVSTTTAAATGTTKQTSAGASTSKAKTLRRPTREGTKPLGSSLTSRSTSAGSTASASSFYGGSASAVGTKPATPTPSYIPTTAGNPQTTSLASSDGWYSPNDSQQQQQQPLLSATTPQYTSTGFIQSTNTSTAAASDQQPQQLLPPQQFQQQPQQQQMMMPMNGSQQQQQAMLSGSMDQQQPMQPTVFVPTVQKQNDSTTGAAASIAYDDWDEANEPPLLEELGINVEHILLKTKAVVLPFSLNKPPFNKLMSLLNRGKGMQFQQDLHHEALVLDPKLIVSDADLAGPLALALLLGGELLLCGKIQFGYIYGFGLFGCLSMTLIMNLMTPGDGVSFWTVTSILGYSLLPVNVLAVVKIVFINLLNWSTLGRLLALLTVVWSTVASTRLFEMGCGMFDQRYLIAYPIALLYSAFVLITIF